LDRTSPHAAARRTERESNQMDVVDESAGLSRQDEGTSVAGHTMLVVGAGSGIGRAVASHLAARGARVFCIDNDATANDAVLHEIAGRGGRAAGSTCDITEPEQVSDAVAKASEEFGRLHGLVNCAGITGETGIPSHEVSLADLHRVMQVNLYGAFLLSKTVIPLMIPHRYGRVLHISSISGKEGNAGMVAYSSSKAALIGMVKAQGKEYALTGVTVNALAPAVIRTPLVDKMPAHQVEYMTSRIPMERCGTLSEAAEMIAWIVSPAASFTTGFTFDLSGGRATY
jgi:3-oxoacyl-[acyl-carrier protein] reductase